MLAHWEAMGSPGDENTDSFFRKPMGVVNHWVSIPSEFAIESYHQVTKSNVTE